jgi:CRISPR type III-B/RAMP module RAMP protein Cmr1
MPLCRHTRASGWSRQQSQIFPICDILLTSHLDMVGLSVRFELIALTPIFNGGAAGQPELLRGPSLKGLILWWVRAMLGGLGADPGAIHELLGARFGHQDAGSRLRIQVEGPRASVVYSGPPADELWGFKYLAYGLDSRHYYHPDQPNRLMASLRCEDEATLRMAWCGLWLLSRFGGIGARCRRGMGSFEIRNAGDPPRGLPSLEPENVSTEVEWANALTKGLNQIANALAGGGQSLTFQSTPTHPTFATSPLPSFSCFRSGFWRATVWRVNYTDWQLALNELGNRYQKDRRGTQRSRGRLLSRDFAEANRFEDTGRANSPVLAPFGLPLTFRFTSGDHKGATVGVRAHSADPRAKTGLRRASPLFLKIIRNGAGDYFCLAHFFKCRLVENDELQFYMLRKSRNRVSSQRPTGPLPVDWSVAETFLRRVSQGSDMYV